MALVNSEQQSTECSIAPLRILQHEANHTYEQHEFYRLLRMTKAGLS
jgi:hypothetical protein